jgi:hypothetical protein
MQVRHTKMVNQQIITFIKVADCGSFSKAAEEMFVSTVAVMKQVNTLESRMGIKLLIRHAFHGDAVIHEVFADVPFDLRFPIFRFPNQSLLFIFYFVCFPSAT